MADTSPKWAPEAPKTTVPPATEKILLKSKEELADLKSKLDIKADPSKQKELDEVEKIFNDKDKIIKITQKSLDALRNDINDADEKINGSLVINDGELIYNEVTPDWVDTPKSAPDTPTVPETSVVPEVNLNRIEGIKIPEDAQETMAKFPPSKRDFWQVIWDKLLDFVAKFWLGDWVAQIRWFNNENLEKKAETAYNMLVWDEWTSLLSQSPLSNIIILEHIWKNEFKKILGQYPTLDFSNKINIEAAFLGKHADKPELAKYHRIYEGMREMCAEFSSTDGLTYNPEARLKQLLSYSRKEEMDINVGNNTPGSAPLFVTSPSWDLWSESETEKILPEKTPQEELTEALDADKELVAAKDKLNIAQNNATLSPEEKTNAIQKAQNELKEAQDKIDTIRDYAKKRIEQQIETDKKWISDAKILSDALWVQIEGARKANKISEVSKLTLEQTSINKKRDLLIGLDKELNSSITQITGNSSAYKIILLLQSAYVERKNTSDAINLINSSSTDIDQIEMTKLDEFEKDITTLLNQTNDKTQIFTINDIEGFQKKRRELEKNMSELMRKKDTTEDPLLKAKIISIEGKNWALRNNFSSRGILGADPIKPDYDEAGVDWNEKLSDISVINPLALLGYSEDKKTAYIEVKNFGKDKKSWILRLRTDTNDTNASFYNFSESEGEKDWSPESKNTRIQQVERDAWDWSFRTIELDGTWLWTEAWTDHDLDWKDKNITWASQIKEKLGIDLWV